MTSKMMSEKDALDFKNGAYYTFKLLEFVNKSYEISISQQTLNSMLRDAVKRSKEESTNQRVVSFGSSIKENFDFVSLFKDKKGIFFANQMVQNSDINDSELLDFIISSSENRAFQIGGKLALRAYEIENAEKFENYTPTQLQPNVEKTLKTA